MGTWTSSFGGENNVLINEMSLLEEQASLLKQLFNKGLNIDGNEHPLVTDFKNNDNTYDLDKIESFTKCDYLAIDKEDRLDLMKLLPLEQMGNRYSIKLPIPDDDTKQLVSVKLFQTIPSIDYEFFCSEFDKDKNILINQYNTLDGVNREHFVEILESFCDNLKKGDLEEPSEWVVALNLASGASIGGYFIGGDIALHGGMAYDSKGNILIYTSGEFFIDFFSTTYEVFENLTIGGNLASSETVVGLDMDLLDIEGALIWDGNVYEYLNTTDLTIDFIAFSISLAYDGEKRSGRELISTAKGIKASVSSGVGITYSWSKTDILSYIIINQDEFSAINQLIISNMNRRFNENSEPYKLKFILDTSSGYYRLFLEGSDNIGNPMKLDSGVDFIKVEEGTFGEGYRSLNSNL